MAATHNVRWGQIQAESGFAAQKQQLWCYLKYHNRLYLIIMGIKGE